VVVSEKESDSAFDGEFFEDDDLSKRNVLTVEFGNIG